MSTKDNFLKYHKKLLESYEKNEDEYMIQQENYENIKYQEKLNKEKINDLKDKINELIIEKDLIYNKYKEKNNSLKLKISSNLDTIFDITHKLQCKEIECKKLTTENEELYKKIESSTNPKIIYDNKVHTTTTISNMKTLKIDFNEVKLNYNESFFENMSKSPKVETQISDSLLVYIYIFFLFCTKKKLYILGRDNRER